jgi:hypothetical protein
MHKMRGIAACCRYAEHRPADAVRHASLLPSGAESAAKQWRYRQQASARCDQYKRKRFVPLTAFQLFFTFFKMNKRADLRVLSGGAACG